MILATWLLHSIRLAAALGMALLVMQAPAVTREYQAALLQLVRSSEHEIAERKASVQRFYGIAPEKDDDRFLVELRDLSFAAAVYGLVGLFFGSLIGELLSAALLPRHRLAR